jgi:hypothetical protein
LNEQTQVHRLGSARQGWFRLPEFWVDKEARLCSCFLKSFSGLAGLEQRLLDSYHASLGCDSLALKKIREFTEQKIKHAFAGKEAVD